MRKLLIMVVLALMVTPAMAQSLPRCNVGANPVDKDRMPTASEEVVINPADEAIRYKSGNGSIVACNLQAGVPVVVDKTTRVAKWVFGCGNDIVSPTDWVPKFVSLRGPQGPAGPQGPKGDQGDPGTSVDRIAFQRMINASILRRPSTSSELTVEVEAKKNKGFWCFQKAWKLGLCAVGAYLAGKEIDQRWLRHRDPKPKPEDPEGQAPGVTTEGVVVTCEATSWPNTCPGSPPVVTTGGKRGFGFSIPIG